MFPNRGAVLLCFIYSVFAEFASRGDGTKENELHLAKAIHQQYIQTGVCFAREVSADLVGCRDAAKGKKAVCFVY
jgi:hypothetical protein